MVKLTLIAERALSCNGVDDVIIRIWQPGRYTGELKDYYCNYEIIGGGMDHSGHSTGTDGFSAIKYAIQSLDTILKTSKAYKSGNLIWRGGMTNDDLGLIAYDA